jgi:uncharacterized protein YbjT (DUF2867 family)
VSNQPDVKRAFVFGGTGTVGSAILRELARRSVHATFTYHRSEAKVVTWLALENSFIQGKVIAVNGGI